MTPEVIELFKVVNINKHQRDRLPLADSVLKLRVKFLIKITAVADLGQSVSLALHGNNDASCAASVPDAHDRCEGEKEYLQQVAGFTGQRIDRQDTNIVKTQNQHSEKQ